MENLTVEQAKEFLTSQGHFVDNLWHVNDVKKKYDCTDEQAQIVLNNVLTGEWLCGEINQAIDFAAKADNLSQKKGKHFLISGYYKNTKTPFENYLVQELENESEYNYDVEENENIFLYDFSEDDIKNHIKLGEKTWLKFVITSYEETTLK